MSAWPPSIERDGGAVLGVAAEQPMAAQHPEISQAGRSRACRCRGGGWIFARIVAVGCDVIGLGQDDVDFRKRETREADVELQVRELTKVDG